MNSKFPYNTSDLKPSRRDFMRLGGGSLAAAMMMRYGALPILAQAMGDIPAELHPGSPNNPRGWATTLPPIPEGMPVDPPVTITGSRRGPWEFAEGDNIENSNFTRLNAAVTGIIWKLAFSWTDNEEEVLQKYNLAIASNDLPDFMETVPLQIYAELLENDLLEDITDVYDEVAHPVWLKEAWSFGNGAAWQHAEVNGRKMGLPHTEQAAQNDKLLWIRQDWLDAVGMSAPTTVDELYAVAKAFVEADLGQGPEGSTIGIAAANNLVTWYSSLDPIFGAWGVMPGYWTPDDSGDLQYNSVLPEIKEVLGTCGNGMPKASSPKITSRCARHRPPLAKSAPTPAASPCRPPSPPSSACQIASPTIPAHAGPGAISRRDPPASRRKPGATRWSIASFASARLRACRSGAEADRLVGGTAAESGESLPWLRGYRLLLAGR